MKDRMFQVSEAITLVTGLPFTSYAVVSRDYKLVCARRLFVYFNFKYYTTKDIGLALQCSRASVGYMLREAEDRLKYEPYMRDLYDRVAALLG